MFRRRFWLPLLIVLLVFVGCGLFYGRRVAKQEPVKIYKPVEVAGEATAPKPKPTPPGETAESGHWHGDEWHAEPHETDPPPVAAPPLAEAQPTPTQRTPDFVNPTRTSSNPLFAEGVPEHLQCPEELIDTYAVEFDPVTRERMYQITGEILEKYNPNRPLTEVWAAFMSAERWYHDNADPEMAGISMGANRVDWMIQIALDFPEMIVLAQEDVDRAFNMRLVELGVFSPDVINKFTLPDGSGRTFRTDGDKQYIFRWGAFYRETEGGFEQSEGFVYKTGPSNGDPNAEVIEINLDEISDEALEALKGWDYNINPYTTGAYKLGDNK